MRRQNRECNKQNLEILYKGEKSNKKYSSEIAFVTCDFIFMFRNKEKIYEEIIFKLLYWCKGREKMKSVNSKLDLCQRGVWDLQKTTLAQVIVPHESIVRLGPKPATFFFKDSLSVLLLFSLFLLGCVGPSLEGLNDFEGRKNYFMHDFQKKRKTSGRKSRSLKQTSLKYETRD